MATISGAQNSDLYIDIGSNDVNGLGQALADVASRALQEFSLRADSSNASSGMAFTVLSSPGTTTTLSDDLVAAVINANGPMTVQGGASQASQLILADSGDLTYFTNGGSGTLVTGDGNNAITASTRSDAVFSVTTGFGNDTISALDGSNTVSAGLGRNVIFSGKADSSSDNLILSNGTDVVYGSGPGRDIIVGGQSSQLLVNENDKSNVILIGFKGAATVFGGSGGNYQLWGGDGGGLLQGGSAGHNVLIGSEASSSTLIGGGDGDLLYARGAATTVLMAGQGNETLVGAYSSGNNYFYAGSGSDLIIGGAGDDVLVAGQGAATLDGGAGADLFSFVEAGQGHASYVGDKTDVVILNFRPEEGDRVQLANFGSDAVNQVLTTAVSTQSFGMSSTSVTLSDGVKITFTGVTGLNSGSFI